MINLFAVSNYKDEHSAPRVAISSVCLNQLEISRISSTLVSFTKLKTEYRCSCSLKISVPTQIEGTIFASDSLTKLICEENQIWLFFVFLSVKVVPKFENHWDQFLGYEFILSRILRKYYVI